MIIIDANALVVLIVGLINPNLVSKHKRTSLYEKRDFEELINVIGDLKNLVVLPNVWTETDNLLNDFRGELKYSYVQKITNTIKASSEKYIETIKSTEMYEFYNLGVTDSLILEYAKNCDILITSDSVLSDYALANGINVFDMKKNVNKKFV